MENKDKELTVPKWVLIVRPKIPQMPQKISDPNVCASPKVRDFWKKLSLFVRSPWFLLLRKFNLNQALWSWFERPISNHHTRQDYDFLNQICYTHFSSIFYRSCQSHFFFAQYCYMSWHVWVAIWCKNLTQVFQPFWNSSNTVQKTVDLTTPAKNRRKISIIDLNFLIKNS